MSSRLINLSDRFGHLEDHSHSGVRLFHPIPSSLGKVFLHSFLDSLKMRAPSLAPNLHNSSFYCFIIAIRYDNPISSERSGRETDVGRYSGIHEEPVPHSEPSNLSQIEVMLLALAKLKSKGFNKISFHTRPLKED